MWSSGGGERFLKKLVDSQKDFDMVIAMKIQDIKKLKAGDKVWWSDPDELSDCSRIYDIKTIEVVNPEMVRIVDKSGDVLECLPKELKRARKYIAKLYWEMCAEVEVWAGDKQSGIKVAIDGPLPSSDEWQYVDDSANVDEELDIHEVKES